MWSSANIQCTGVGDNPATAVIVSTIILHPPRAILFPYTTLFRSTITIVKDAVPNDAQDFAFTTTGGGPAAFTTGFSLDDDSDPTLSNSQTFTFKIGRADV